MTVSNSTGGPLTALQRAIVDYVAARGPVTAAQVRQGIKGTRPLTDSTIRTLLRRLEARGLISHAQQGRAFLYRTDLSSSRVAVLAVRTLIDECWGGSSQRFLASLLKEKVLSPADLERVARRARAVK